MSSSPFRRHNRRPADIRLCSRRPNSVATLFPFLAPHPFTRHQRAAAFPLFLACCAPPCRLEAFLARDAWRHLLSEEQLQTLDPLLYNFDGVYLHLPCVVRNRGVMYSACLKRTAYHIAPTGNGQLPNFGPPSTQRTSC